MCVCYVLFTSVAVVVGQENTRKDTHPFSTPVSLAHSPPSHITITHFCFSYNPIRSLTHSSLFHSHTPCTLFSLLCVYCLSPSLAHSPDSCIACFLCTLPFCTSLSLPGAPASLTTHLPSSPAHPPPTHTHPFTHLFYPSAHPFSWPLPSLHPPPGSHTRPRLWGHLLVPGRAGMRSRGHFSSSPLPRPAPPSIPHRLPGSRPARPPLRGGLRRRRRRKEPPFATAERTGRAGSASRSGTGARRTAMGGGPAAGGPGRVTPGARPAPDPDPRGATP